MIYVDVSMCFKSQFSSIGVEGGGGTEWEGVVVSDVTHREPEEGWEGFSSEGALDNRADRRGLPRPYAPPHRQPLAASMYRAATKQAAAHMPRHCRR